MAEQGETEPGSRSPQPGTKIGSEIGSANPHRSKKSRRTRTQVNLRLGPRPENSIEAVRTHRRPGRSGGEAEREEEKRETAIPSIFHSFHSPMHWVLSFINKPRVY
jgi:hypothetical protein